MEQYPHNSLDQLNFEISKLLNPKNGNAYAFSAFVKNRIQQFGLTGHLDHNAVINEAYKRGVVAIDAGKEVKQWNAWLKIVCLNIIREHSRKRRRNPLIDPHSALISNLPAQDSINRIERETERAIVQKRVKILSEALDKLERIEPQSVQLLQWRLIENLSWQTIQDLLPKSEEVPSVSTLRKQGSRAKHKLRRIYHQIEENYAEATASHL